jgi:hypothetical protein
MPIEGTGQTGKLIVVWLPDGQPESSTPTLATTLDNPPARRTTARYGAVIGVCQPACLCPEGTRLSKRHVSSRDALACGCLITVAQRRGEPLTATLLRLVHARLGQ